jgi:hypothetical protein
MDTFHQRDFQLEGEVEFTKATSLCNNQKNMAPLWKQTIVPIRTDEASDLFLPTLMNYALKTKDCANNVFIVMGALVWDLCTLPIRLITYLPRLAYNATRTSENHPLIPYLEGKKFGFIHSTTWSPGEPHRAPEKEGRLDILLYKKEPLYGSNGKSEQNKGTHYTLHLTNREIAFPIYNKKPYTFITV